MYIELKTSAFSHKISEADILHAFTKPYYDGPIEDIDKKSNRFLRLGFDTVGNLLEILYNAVCVTTYIMVKSDNLYPLAS